MAATTSFESGLILYDDALVDQPDGSLFNPEDWRRRDALQPTRGGRGASWMLARPENDWVLRHYRRGGAMRFLDDRYLWPGTAARTRSWREWRYLAEMRASELPVPRPVAAHVQRFGLIWRGDLITERIPDARPLAAWLVARNLADPPWRGIGATLARFHAAGAAHPDLNAHNILIQSDQTVWLIDFDHGGWRSPAGAWAERNLSRLKRSLLKVAAAADTETLERDCWSAILSGYR